jgi:hypothetical protein
MRERLPQREERHNHPRDGRPQPCDQQCPQGSRKHVKYRRFGGAAASKRDNSFRNQCATSHQPHQQQADTRQTVGECRIEASQMRSGYEILGWPETPKGSDPTPLSRYLQLDDSALERDHRCVGTVIGVQFGEDVTDLALDCFFADR